MSSRPLRSSTLEQRKAADAVAGALQRAQRSSARDVFASKRDASKSRSTKKRTHTDVQLDDGAQAETDDASMQEEEQQEGSAAPEADSAALRKQLAELAQLVRDQQRAAEEQQQEIARLRASPAHSPHHSVSPSPQRSPQQAQRNIAAAAAAAASVPPAAPAPRKKEPRLSDLAEYSGASGDKLDAWLAELRRCARYYQLSGADAVEFAVARLRDTADMWWAALDSDAQAAISNVDTLASALRDRFQPVTTARVAREKNTQIFQSELNMHILN